MYGCTSIFKKVNILINMEGSLPLSKIKISCAVCVYITQTKLNQVISDSQLLLIVVLIRTSQELNVWYVAVLRVCQNHYCCQRSEISCTVFSFPLFRINCPEFAPIELLRTVLYPMSFSFFWKLIHLANVRGCG